MSDYSLFKSKAPWIMSKLIADFSIDALDAAAILGNLGHECNGFKSMQEINPTVAGSRGGLGWSQWTGPRRRAYEAYCKRNSLNTSSDKANYAYLFIELKGLEGSEGGSIKKLKAASGLKAKTIAFEEAFLRAGIKHYDNRITYAQMALEAFDEMDLPDVAAVPVPTPRPQIDLSPIGNEPTKPTDVVVVEAPAPTMNKYNKAIGAFIGGLVPLVILNFPGMEQYLSPDLQNAAIVILSTIGTIVASKNAR